MGAQEVIKNAATKLKNAAKRKAKQAKYITLTCLFRLGTTKIGYWILLLLLGFVILPLSSVYEAIKTLIENTWDMCTDLKQLWNDRKTVINAIDENKRAAEYFWKCFKEA
ncbi:MAG: hypothetical protein RR091_10810 [Cloacibacillus sp.]